MTQVHRLDSLDPDLRARLEKLDDGELRRTSRSAARQAVSGTRLEERCVDAGLAAVGTAGRRDTREAVREVVQRLDEVAWGMGNEVEAGGDAYTAAFARARAAAAVEWTLDDDPLTAALEAVYEAHAAGVPLSDLRAAIGRP